MTSKLRIGIITKAHGIKGEVKVYPTTDDPLRFESVEEAELRSPDQKKYSECHIESVKFFKNVVILKLKGVDDMDSAEALRGYELYIPRDEGVPLSENEYYIADILGMDAVTDDGIRLGVITDVMQTGANDVYVVRRDEKLQKSGSGDILIPAIKQCVLDVSLKGNRVTVRLLDGLLEL